MQKPILTSLTRIAGFDARPPDVGEIPRQRWAEGDYVVGEVLGGTGFPSEVEHASGRMVEVVPSDLIVGALGRRTATLRIVGDWRAVDDDRLDALTVSGVLGRCTSAAIPPPPMSKLRYVGHALRDGERVTMSGCVDRSTSAELTAPVVLLTGTSMQAGKTTTGKALIRRLKRMGVRVTGTKLTGVGRYRDILSFADAGADHVLDFVDAGLPSSATEKGVYEDALRQLLSMIAATEPDVVIAEAGASPLEPYNGETAIRILGDRVRLTVLSASDPYAVAGVIQAFGSSPDLVAGWAASNSAAIELVDRLTGLPAVSALDPNAGPLLDQLLIDKLGITSPAAMSSPTAT